MRNRPYRNAIYRLHRPREEEIRLRRGPALLALLDAAEREGRLEAYPNLQQLREELAVELAVAEEQRKQLAESQIGKLEDIDLAIANVLATGPRFL